VNPSPMNPLQHCLILLVRLYRWTLSPAKIFLFGPLSQCRFTPSCSEYALEAIKTHGSAPGAWLALKRICRCHPWGGCGHDPVPQRFKIRSSSFKDQRLTPSHTGSTELPLSLRR